MNSPIYMLLRARNRTRSSSERRAFLEAQFIGETTAAGLVELKGHRSVGGIRASIYNAFPKAGVEALVSFMKEFERTHG